MFKKFMDRKSVQTDFNILNSFKSVQTFKHYFKPETGLTVLTVLT